MSDSGDELLRFFNKIEPQGAKKCLVKNRISTSWMMMMMMMVVVVVVMILNIYTG